MNRPAAILLVSLGPQLSVDLPAILPEYIKLNDVFRAELFFSPEEGASSLMNCWLPNGYRNSIVEPFLY